VVNTSTNGVLHRPASGGAISATALEEMLHPSLREFGSTVHNLDPKWGVSERTKQSRITPVGYRH